MKKLTEEKKNEILGVILFILGAIFILNLFFENTGRLGMLMAELTRFFLGRGALVVALLLFYAGFRLIKEKVIDLGIKGLGLFLVITVLLAFFHMGLQEGEELEVGLKGLGGGILGGGLLWLLRSAFAEVGTYVILLGLGLIGLLLMSEKNLTTLVAAPLSLFKRKKKVEERYEEEEEFYEPPPQVKSIIRKERNKRVGKRRKEREEVEEKEVEIEEEEIAPPLVFPEGKYVLPPLKFLDIYANPKAKTPTDQSIVLEKTLSDFGIDAKVVHLTYGPRISRYEIQPAPGIKVSRIVSLADDIALALAAPDVRIEAPVPGKSVVGIEVPHKAQRMVGLKETLASIAFKEEKSRLPLVLGLDISGQAVVKDLSRMPHLLVAGATGTGKSVCINTMILSILFKAAPYQVKMVLIDPKQVEMTNYQHLPHLLTPIVTSAKKAAAVLNLMVEEMESRYALFSKEGVRGIEEYNQLKNLEDPDDALPAVVIIIDELADLMMVAAHDVEEAICRLAQKARAAGIHLIIATQRPSVDIITGLIKVNIPCRISFYVSSQVDSRTILDTGGAEKLMGDGDMLFAPVGAIKPIRIQAPYVSNNEVKRIVEFIKKQYDAEYKFDLEDVEDKASNMGEQQLDEYYQEAVQLVVENQLASISMLQRRLNIGYNRAARLIDMMEEHNIIGPYAGTKPRKVFISQEELPDFLNKCQEQS